MRRAYVIRLAIALSSLAACEHTAPFSPVSGGSNGPLFPASITQLTYSSGQDVIPEWLPDGSAFVYTAERLDRVDHDRCLAFMPDSGGTISRYACPTVAPDDSIHVLDEAAIVGDSIAYVRASTERFVQGIGPDRQELVVAPLADPNAARVLQRLPFTTPWGATYDAIAQLAWIGPAGDRLAFIGERVTYPRPCSSCIPDTVRTGVGLVLADVGAGSLVLTRMPDGDSASSLAVSANGDSIYFTKVGDSRVFRRTLSAARTDTVLDFVFGVARDVTVSSGLLAAVVGGNSGGPTASDRGGFLVLVNGAGPVQLGDSSFSFRRPALSPSGDRLVVSATVGVPNADLWLFQLR